ncbi:MAG: energy transducer TonB [Gammaproteobacteria bacterium]|nr:energy transducer TonB [Gammaproteobacteria bacterium]
MKIDPRLVVAVLLPPLVSLAGGNNTAAVADSPGDAGRRIPLHTVVPQYPEKARRARVEGEVEVCFNVDRDGNTKRVTVRRSTNRVFEKTSRDAVRQSSYKPLPPGEQLSGIKTCRTFRFHLTPVSVETPGN